MTNKTEIVLNDEEKKDIDSPLTIQELEKAMKNMESGKVPDCDGLPVEIYHCLWDGLSDPLYEAIMFAYEKGELHLSARRDIISLIPKESRDNTL